MIRAISGKRKTTPVYHLRKEDGEKAETPSEIVEALADNYVKQSSFQNHCNDAKAAMSREEKNDLNFKSDNKENYNRKFTLKDLRKALKKAKAKAEEASEHLQIDPLSISSSISPNIPQVIQHSVPGK